MPEPEVTYSTQLFKQIPATATMYTATALYNKDELYTKNDLYTKTDIQTMSGNLASAIEQAASKVYRVKGSVADLTELYGITNPTIGDVYNVEESGDNYVYVGSATGSGITSGWDNLGGIMDLTPYTKWADISGAYNIFATGSGNWNSAYSAVAPNSGMWTSAYSAVAPNSGSWNTAKDYLWQNIHAGLNVVDTTYFSNLTAIDPDSAYKIEDIVTLLNTTVSALSTVIAYSRVE